MDILKKIKTKFKDFKDNLTIDDIHCMFHGVAVGTYLITFVQAIQIDNLKVRINNMDAEYTRCFKLATNNDFKSYNQFKQCTAAIDAIVEGLKTTHPGIVQYVNDAVANAEQIEIPYPDV